MRLPDGQHLYTPHAEFGLTDHRGDAPHFTEQAIQKHPQDSLAIDIK